MQRSISRALIGGTAVLVTTVSLAVAAWPGKPGGDRAPDPEHMVERLTRHLELTAEQQDRAEEIFSQGFEEARADHERIEELHESLRGQVAEFDAGAAQATADEIGAITSRMVYRRASAQASLYQILDEEQRAELEAFAKKREKRREHFREHRRGPMQ